MAATQNATHTNRLAGATSPYSAPARAQSGGLVAMGAGGAGRGQALAAADPALGRLCRLPLVPRDGARVASRTQATAAVMNELFVNIKVDREERPDIDQIYMNALHLLGEQGGWPLTMFLTPAGEPVWGGTYFPKESRFGRPAFVDVLREVARMFREEPGKIEQNRDALLARLAEKARPEGKVTIGLQGARRRRGAGRQHVRLRQRRPARRAEISAAGDDGDAVAGAGCARGDAALLRHRRAFARAHERGRHLRSSRRRLLALFGRRALAGAAFREDAVRQRPALGAAGAGLAAQRQCAVRASARARRSAGSRAR